MVLVMIKMILACDLNGVIGNGNELPWGKSLPYDLNRFKELTEGHIVVMGRKTFESIGSKPLPNRENVVLTSRPINVSNKPEGLYYANDIGCILDQYDYTGGDRDLWIIGGMNVYKQFIPYVQEVYITKVKNKFTGDTKLDEGFISTLDNDFCLYTMSSKGKDEKNKYGMTFEKLVRIKGEYK